jgi:hypothetical protein
MAGKELAADLAMRAIQAIAPSKAAPPKARCSTNTCKSRSIAFSAEEVGDNTLPLVAPIRMGVCCSDHGISRTVSEGSLLTQFESKLRRFSQPVRGIRLTATVCRGAVLLARVFSLGHHSVNIGIAECVFATLSFDSQHEAASRKQQCLKEASCYSYAVAKRVRSFSERAACPKGCAFVHAQPMQKEVCLDFALSILLTGCVFANTQLHEFMVDSFLVGFDFGSCRGSHAGGMPVQFTFGYGSPFGRCSADPTRTFGLYVSTPLHGLVSANVSFGVACSLFRSNLRGHHAHPIIFRACLFKREKVILDGVLPSSTCFFAVMLVCGVIS